jgi:hypothetical protein
MNIGRAVLAIILLAGFYLLAVAAMVAALAAGVLPAYDWAVGARGLTASGLAVLGLGSVPVVYEIAYALLAAARMDQAYEGSVAVSRSGAADLWALIDDMAVRVGTAAPTELRLIDEANAMVAERVRLSVCCPRAGTFISECRCWSACPWMNCARCCVMNWATTLAGTRGLPCSATAGMCRWN